MARNGQRFGDALGDTIADALNSLYREAAFLERIGAFLVKLGDLAPPCAVVPYTKERLALIDLADRLRASLPAASTPEIREAVARAVDTVYTKLKSSPTITQAWVYAPVQWQVGAFELTRSSTTGSLGWVAGDSNDTWDDVQSAGRALLELAGLGWLVTLGPVGAIIAGVSYGGGIGEMIRSHLEQPASDLAGSLKSVVDDTIHEAVKFEQRFKPAIYQQILGAWLLVKTSASPEIMRAAMRSMNPYTLPPMPEAWDGSFAHMQRAQAQEGGSWLIALLLGGFVGLSVAALTME